LWFRYCHDILAVDQDEKIDPDEIWIRLCEGDKEAIATCKTFLWDYVDEISVRWVMVLGPEEYVQRRMVNSANTVLAMWRGLVKEADLTVLAKRRHEEPMRADMWRLRFHNYNARHPTSSIATFDISKVSFLPPAPSCSSLIC
jgi:hypothetical protein